jgi:hypothetical protein
MTFAALGHVPPVLAAAMHTVGSLMVVFNSARLVRKGEELEHYQPEAAAPLPARPVARPPAAAQLTATAA